MFGSSLNNTRLLRYAGLFTYLSVGMPLVSNWAQQRLSLLHRPDTAWLIWAGCYLLFGVIYWLLTSNLASRRYWALKMLSLAVMTASAIIIGWASHSGLSAMLMVVISVVLPWQLPLWLGVSWMVLQHYSLVLLFSHWPEYHYNLGLAILQSSVYLGISALVFIVSLVATRQAEERERQRQLNSELRATRALLAESSRIAERMRISRELHDLVGHHLTALSLNLEVASHLSQAPASDHVRKAQDTAKQLLADVREVVSELRQDAELDLTQAINSLIEGVPSLRVHLTMPPRFAIEDPQRAQVLLRWMQEVLTNAVRHANARNLWLRIERDREGGLVLDARDDGRGAPHLKPGNGLTGMRERLAEVGGRLDIPAKQARGFQLQAWLPLDPEVGLSGPGPRPASSDAT